MRSAHRMPALTLALAASLSLALTGGTAEAAPSGGALPGPTDARLAARSILPAETYVPGSEPSGHWTKGAPGIPAPYPGQPVQGFSATHRLADGSYLVMSDNGFGTKANSADAQLAVHQIKPDAGTGRTLYVRTVFTLSDPNRLVPWSIWRDGACASATDLPAGYGCAAADRVLTGSDFDIESMQIAPDGSYWFGDEFGPWLLHTDQQGRLLEAPIATPGVKSPSNATLAPGETPNLADSKGFEGMAISPDGTTLYPMLEGATAQDKAAGRERDLLIHTVALQPQAHFTPASIRYRMEDPAHAIGDAVAVNSNQLLVIERDGGAGATARFKRVYLVDLRDSDHDGYVTKHLLVDLMAVPDPAHVGGAADTFTFPFVTIEDVEIVDDHTIAVMNDNNFPGGGGRGEGVVDANEYIEIDLGAPLRLDRRLLAGRNPAPAPGQPAFDLQAHRGGLGLTTEETPEAFAKAIELGVTTLELDTQITEDGAVVVTHDRQVQARKCRDTAPATPGDPEFPYVGDFVNTLTLAQVKTLDCGYQQLPDRPRQEVVTGAKMAELKDVFAVVRAHDARHVRLNIETKIEAGAPSETAPRELFVRRVHEEIRAARIQRQVTVQSFDWGALMQMHRLAPEIPLVALTNYDFLQVGQPGASPWLGGIDADDFGGSAVRAAASIEGVTTLSPNYGFPQDGTVGQPGFRFYADRAMVSEAHANGLKVVPWTVNDADTMLALMDNGVDGLITDYPDVARALLAERRMPLPRAYPAR